MLTCHPPCIFEKFILESEFFMKIIALLIKILVYDFKKLKILELWKFEECEREYPG